METLKSTKVDWKKLAVVVALVFLTAVTVGGLTWYVTTAGAQGELDSHKNNIVRLETQIKQLLADEKNDSNQDVDAVNTESKKRDELLIVCQNSHKNDTVQIKQYVTNYAECSYSSNSNVSGAVGSVFVKYDGQKWVILLDTQAVNEDAETMLLEKGFPKEFFSKPWLNQ